MEYELSREEVVLLKESLHQSLVLDALVLQRMNDLAGPLLGDVKTALRVEEKKALYEKLTGQRIG